MANLNKSPNAGRMSAADANRTIVNAGRKKGTATTTIVQQIGGSGAGSSVTVTPPLQMSGSVVSLPQATGSVSGYLLSADWTTFNAKMTNPMTTTGDMILGGSGGTPTRVGIGASTYVWTSNGTTASWQASGGGGGALWYEYEIDIPPGSPSAYDDEFATGTLDAKWAVINTTPGNVNRSATSNAYGSGFLVLESPYTTSDRVYGVQQDTSALGTTPFTVTAKVKLDSPNNPYNGIGIFVRDSLTGNMIWFGMINNAGTHGLAPILDVQRFDGSLNLNSEPYSGIQGDWFRGYLRVKYDGTNYYCLYSATGLFTDETGSSVVWTEPAASWVGTSAGAMGVSIYPYGQLTRGMYDWFRLTTP